MGIIVPVLDRSTVIAMDATTILVEAGIDDAIALERGEDRVVTIEGALILSQGLNNLAPFQRVMQQLP